jgi:hypothetical protein
MSRLKFAWKGIIEEGEVVTPEVLEKWGDSTEADVAGANVVICFNITYVDRKPAKPNRSSKPLPDVGFDAVAFEQKFVETFFDKEPN